MEVLVHKHPEDPRKKIIGRRLMSGERIAVGDKRAHQAGSTCSWVKVTSPLVNVEIPIGCSSIYVRPIKNGGNSGPKSVLSH